MFIGGVRRHSPNISEIARKLVKILPCCKRNGHGLFCYLFLISNSILSLLIVGQIDSGAFTIGHIGHVPRFP